MCDWENLEGNFIDRHTIQRDKYWEGNLPRQTLNDICNLDDGTHKNWGRLTTTN